MGVPLNHQCSYRIFHEINQPFWPSFVAAQGTFPQWSAAFHPSCLGTSPWARAVFNRFFSWSKLGLESFESQNILNKNETMESLYVDWFTGENVQGTHMFEQKKNETPMRFSDFPLDFPPTNYPMIWSTPWCDEMRLKSAWKLALTMTGFALSRASAKSAFKSCKNVSTGWRPKNSKVNVDHHAKTCPNGGNTGDRVVICRDIIPIHQPE